MQPDDTTFGTGFDADKFRSAIRSTMQMGLPVNTADRATFRWTPVRTFASQDQSGEPFDLTATPASEETHDDVQIPVAVEFSARPSQSVTNVMGEFDSTLVKLTVLDVDYALITGADLVLLGQNIYEIQYVEPPEALFTVGVYTLHAVARDES